MRTLLLVSVALALATSNAPTAGEPTAAAYAIRVPLGLDEYLPVPEDNLLTAEKVALGEKLFFDKRLSRDATVACASCHVPERAFTNGQRVARGIGGRRGTRNVPTLFNRAYGISQFWDGRARTLDEQVLEPIQSVREMGMKLPELERRLRSMREYEESFIEVFGEQPTAADAAKAIVAFVRTLLSGNSPFDRFEHGEEGALSAEARRGLDLFRGKANCIVCHFGPTFTDEQFHNTGVAWRGRRFADRGRFAVTGTAEDSGAFKTPTLREVARTAPYMHDGGLATLEDVIEFYDRGGNRNPHLDPEIRSLSLSVEEKQALVTFLRSLSGTIRESVSTPTRPR